MTDANTHIDDHLPRHLEDLDHFLRIRSISTDPEYAGEVREAARWLADRLEQAGLSASIEEAGGHPLVLGRHEAGPEAPTLLIYGHYDIQPPEPLELWTSPPFEPTIRDGRLFARGAADDKSQVFIQIGAAEAALAAGDLPVNLILLFEGEEEIGSEGLTRFVRERGDELPAGHVVISDSLMFGPGRPSLIFGMRGITYFQLDLSIGEHDLHSGQYGGAVPNPAHALARIVASFHDADGRVAVEGFYDGVEDLGEGLRAEWRELEFDEAAFQRTAGGAALSGEAGYSTPERLWIRPCLDVNGVLSGYTGPGKKTVLPARAMAKFSARLVPNQDPEHVAACVHRHVHAVAPAGVAVSLETQQVNRPWRTDPEGPLYRAGARALEAGFGTRPVRVAGGGTLPIAREFADGLGADVTVMGFAVPGANMQAAARLPAAVR